MALPANPASAQILFDLGRCAFGAALSAGQNSAALHIARTRLAPLAEANPEFAPLLKVGGCRMGVAPR